VSAELAGDLQLGEDDHRGEAECHAGRDHVGTLTLAGTYNTGGTGSTTAGFGQGAVTLSRDHQTLLVVNAGSNQVSDFAVMPGGALRLRNVVASGGTDPISVAISGGLAEVLNAGGTAGVAGFRATPAGLRPIAGGSQPLSATANSPEDVAISPDGSQAVVTEKVSDTIDTFAIGQGGVLAPAVTSPSDSPLSFAEVFTPSGQLLVADDGASDSSAVSPYRIAPDGVLTATQPAVSDCQTAACWISLADDGDVFADNAGSGTIASYQLSPSGQLTFLGNTSAGTGAAPLDDAVSSYGRYLYAVIGNQGQLAEFSVGPDAQLTPVETQALPADQAEWPQADHCLLARPLPTRWRRPHQTSDSTSAGIPIRTGKAAALTSACGQLPLLRQHWRHQ
jgi:6-phosphogluconolactonase